MKKEEVGGMVKETTGGSYLWPAEEQKVVGGKGNY